MLIFLYKYCLVHNTIENQKKNKIFNDAEIEEII